MPREHPDARLGVDFSFRRQLRERTVTVGETPATRTTFTGSPVSVIVSSFRRSPNWCRSFRRPKRAKMQIPLRRQKLPEIPSWRTRQDHHGLHRPVSTAADRLRYVELGPALEAALLLDGPLGGRVGLEALVWDRLAAHDRQAVGPGVDPLLGAFDRVELAAEDEAPTLVGLILVELRALVREVLVDVRELAVVGRGERAQLTLDPPALLLEELACPPRIHAAILSTETRPSVCSGR